MRRLTLIVLAHWHHAPVDIENSRSVIWVVNDKAKLVQGLLTTCNDFQKEQQGVDTCCSFFDR